MRHMASSAGLMRPAGDGRSPRDVCLPALSGRQGVQVSRERKQKAIEDGNGTNQTPGQIEFGSFDLAVKLCRGAVDLAVKLCPDQINVLPDQLDFPIKAQFSGIDIGLCRHAAGDAGVDGQRDGFCLFLLETCVAKALYFRDRVERCLDHVGSLFVLTTEIDHSRPDCQRRQFVAASRAPGFDHVPWCGVLP